MPVLPSIAWQSANRNAEPRLLLSGDWDAKHLKQIEQALQVLFPRKHKAIHHQTTQKTTPIILDGSGLSALDISAAWMLVSRLRQTSDIDINTSSLQGFGEEYAMILSMASQIKHPPTPHCEYCGPVNNFFRHVGKSSISIVLEMNALLAFFGELCVTIYRTILNPSRLRLRSTVFHINEICLKAIPIIALMAFMISMVMGYQGANQLDRFGARIFTIDLVTISLLREMGVVITAILVAGRSGSAFAAQIGVMQVNDEVDAMRTIGLDPFELLVLPRVLAIMIALPILTLIADIMGIFGTLFISATVLDVSYLQFVERLHKAVSLDTFFIGMCKAPVFAILIGMVGCLQGMQVKNSAAEVGERTTIAVVQSIFLVVVFDAIFSILFTLAGI